MRPAWQSFAVGFAIGALVFAAAMVSLNVLG
jgi:hypothetical protein